MKKIFYLIITFLFVMTLSSCSKEKYINLSYDKAEITVEQGTEISLMPSVTVGKKVKDYELTYNLSNNIGTISNDGKFIGNSTGVVTLTVTANNKDKSSASIKIKVVKTIFNINFDVKGGVLDGNTTLTFVNSEEVVLPIPTKEGYKFLGWYENGINVTTIEEKDYNLEAKWLQVFTISYDLVGGEVDGELVTTYEAGEEVTLLKPVKVGYEFIGWYQGDVKVTYISDANYQLVARYKAIEYDIEYELDGGTNSSSNPSEYSGDILPFTLGEPTKDGYVFKGWLLNGNVVKVIPIGKTEDITLTAKWAKEYTINYNLDGGNLPNDAITKFHEIENVELPIPTREGYNFKGWFDGETEITEIEYKNYNLTAKWVKVYSITFIKEKGNWPMRNAENQEEIKNALLEDLYAWAKMNGSTDTYEEYSKNIMEKIAASEDINLRNPLLGEQPDGSGDTTYFLNIPEFYDEWIEFFRAFNTVLKTIDPNVNFFYDDYFAFLKFGQFMTWNPIAVGPFEKYLNTLCSKVKVEKEVVLEYEEGTTTVLPTLWLVSGLRFMGWYDNPEFTGVPVTRILNAEKGDKTFYARWAEEVFVENVTLNSIDKLPIYTTYQLKWEFTPKDATYKKVEFYSSDTSIATVNKNSGLITAKGEGTVKIKMRVLADETLNIEFNLTVYTPDHIQASYETNSYVAINDVIHINASLHGATKGEIVWKSSDESIAVVDESGNITGLKAGNVTITASNSNDESIYLDFEILVIDESTDEIIKHILESHESNIFIRKHLGIGSGTPTYFTDVYGSINKILFNDDLYIDETYLASGNADSTDYYKNRIYSDKYSQANEIEFVTVHYTGNMNVGSGASANANYFVGDNSVSIHYTTGNDGVFKALDHKHGAWHAGDSGSVGVAGLFKWNKTGVLYDGTPLLDVEFSASDDFYFEINGKKTIIELPKPYNHKSRNTDHIYNADGTISSNPMFTGTKFTNRTPESFFNKQGFSLKIIDGEYYMGTTWWSYGQVTEGRICSSGGNLNSIGIESCVDQGSDLWYTWQKTAQLVAYLVVQNDLDVSRVKGHHFFDGKDCPQPMLENDLEIWYEFIELVEAEYELLTTFKDYEISFESHNLDVIDNNGRFVKTPDYPTCITYTVTITKDGNTQSITLSSMIPGLYQK